MSTPALANSDHPAAGNGFRVPPEEGPHQATFMQWPVSTKVYPDAEFLQLTQKAIAEIANAVIQFEPVIMLADKSDHRAARRLLSAKIELWNIPTEDLWCRDSGPLFARNKVGELAISQLNFNGWGGKQTHRRDGNIAASVGKILDLPVVDSGLVGEAGGVEADGHGMLIAHESSWVNRNRNTHNRAEIETRLLAAYGANRMIWSPGVRGQDITDYHIDALARFTGPGEILIQLPDAPDMSDPFHVAALDTHDLLLAQGLKMTVIPEPVRPRIRASDFVAAYVNYYVCNTAVITAQFGDKDTDPVALAALTNAFAGREVIQLRVDALGELGGGIHCATQQMPA